MSVYHSGKVEYGAPAPAQQQDKAAELTRLLAAVVKRRREREQLLRQVGYIVHQAERDRRRLRGELDALFDR